MNPLSRLIPCLLLKDGLIVRASDFSVHQIIGSPLMTVSRFSQWNVDELIILNISDAEEHDLRRDDLEFRYHDNTILSLLRQIAGQCSMPLTFGGRVKSVEDIRVFLGSGADKCMINTQAVETPDLISNAAKEFGSQCVVVGIDVKEHSDGRHEVYTEKGRKPTGLDPVAWAQKVESLGAGEIFLNSIDRDGKGAGYDLKLVRAVAEATKIPVVACGGVGEYDHFAQGLIEGGAHAVAAANIFHFHELSYVHAKLACKSKALKMRETSVTNRWLPTDPAYDSGERDKRIAERLARSKIPLPDNTSIPPKVVKWCANCVYPSISAAPSSYDENGVCMGCLAGASRTETTENEWAERKEMFRELLEQYKSKDGSRPDCIIPVSGGKDSYFQVHMVKSMGYTPLLVTYNGNNFMDVGWRNLMRMREVFGVDHIIYGPNVDLLKKLNRLGFIIMGDMNWHSHVGIMTVPMRLGVQLGIPLVIWGEHGYQDLSGQFSARDFVEFTYRQRLEHFARGYEWNYFVGLEGISKKDMQTWRYPNDELVFSSGLRGVYLSNYVKWDANEHVKIVREKYGFEIAEEPFERTYRVMSNLDDMHENGMHDYLKYIKFGYGSCTDHASKDIRAGLISRGEGVRRVERYDHVKSSDLKRWLDYVGMSEKEFDQIADTFRDRRVWCRKNGEWVKRNIWD